MPIGAVLRHPHPALPTPVRARPGGLGLAKGRAEGAGRDLIAQRFDAGGPGNVHFINWWRSTRWSVHACSAPFGEHSVCTCRGSAVTGQ
jgi:hypothetical protein